VGDGLPEIIDSISFAGSHDVVINGTNFGAGVFVFDEAESGHDVS
jgi:hypothetical protein